MASATDNTLPEPPMTVIETERLRLMTVRMSDLDDLMPLITDPDVMQWTSRPPVANREQGERWLSDRALGENVFNFVIELRQDPDTSSERIVVGMLGSFHWPSCGYMIKTEHFGKGYTTEAMKAWIPEFFKRASPAENDGAGFEYLEGSTDSENEASKKVLTKLGFTYIGMREKDFDSPMKGLRDTCHFRLAGPGQSLEQLGVNTLDGSPMGGADTRPVPPIQ